MIIYTTTPSLSLSNSTNTNTHFPHPPLSLSQGSNAQQAFKAELRMAVASCLLLLTVLLLSGAVVYKYFADQVTCGHFSSISHCYYHTLDLPINTHLDS